ncbi:hypothetical protein RM717_06855 [Streptomyces griseus]|uniref:Uncharacterized protein n=2 Tax=Streptomycetaceae TaxID=2062 RepID=A0ABU2VX90_9ACTN|nr:hypothetical protein [Streptomyces griseus]ARF71792.1 hypothetical protein B7C62_05620 [Kitasatospora albolonga]MDT0490220.1 hypothetical protein [Streptomyces griseus]
MSLPGADELFRTTGGGMGLQPSSPADRRRKANGEPRVPAPAGESDPADRAEGGEEHASADAEDARGRGGEGDRRAAAPATAPSGDRPAPAAAPAEQPPAVQQQRRRGGGRGANRRPSGRERHDEKITVYVSAEELMDLEHARLVLRGEHGLAVDRGRIVREAVAVVLADLESRGDASILVRRLRGR